VVHWWTHAYTESAPTEIVILSLSSLATLIFAAMHIFLGSNRLSPLLSQCYHLCIAIPLDALLMLVWGAGSFGTALFLGERACYGPVCKLAQGAALLGGVQFMIAVVMMVRGFVMLCRGDWTGSKDLEMGEGGVEFDVKMGEKVDLQIDERR
jgi:hypothetical protein